MNSNLNESLFKNIVSQKTFKENMLNLVKHINVPADGMVLLGIIGLGHLQAQ